MLGSLVVNWRVDEKMISVIKGRKCRFQHKEGLSKVCMLFLNWLKMFILQVLMPVRYGPTETL